MSCFLCQIKFLHCFCKLSVESRVPATHTTKLERRSKQSWHYCLSLMSKTPISSVVWLGVVLVCVLFLFVFSPEGPAVSYHHLRGFLRRRHVTAPSPGWQITLLTSLLCGLFPLFCGLTLAFLPRTPRPVAGSFSVAPSAVAFSCLQPSTTPRLCFGLFGWSCSFLPLSVSTGIANLIAAH